MVRSELLQKLCNLPSQYSSQGYRKDFRNIFFEITEALCRGENIEIRGFGIFKTTVRKARIGRNPKNSELVQIPEKKSN